MKIFKKQTKLKCPKSKQSFVNTVDLVGAQLVSICVAWKPNKASGNGPKRLALTQISLTSFVADELQMSNTF